MFFRFNGLAAIVSIASLLAAGCSIKEDRSFCPCVLNLSFSLSGVRDGTLWFHLVTDGGFTLSDSVGFSGGAAVYEAMVPRGSCSVTAVQGDMGLYAPDAGEIMAPPGGGFPPLWSCSLDFDTRSDMKTVPVTLHKQHCVLSLSFKKVPPGSLPLSFNIAGSSRGVTGAGVPVAGNLSSAAASPDGISFRAIIPRQAGGDLMLGVTDGHKVLRTFALGSLLGEWGYDWTLDDLEDVSLEVDYAATTVSLSYPVLEEGTENEVLV